MYRIAEQTAL